MVAIESQVTFNYVFHEFTSYSFRLYLKRFKKEIARFGSTIIKRLVDDSHLQHFTELCHKNLCWSTQKGSVEEAFFDLDTEGLVEPLHKKSKSN